MKAKRKEEKKPYVEAMDVPDHSTSRKKIVRRERLIDRDNDVYKERVSDYESGEVIHECEEPLSQHVNHGSAKTRGNGGA